MSENDKENAKFVVMFICGISILLFMIILLFSFAKIITIWTSGISGRADLKEAQWESRVKVEKAKGIAEANRIIGGSLKGNEACLSYHWIDSLQHTKNKIIYVPTGSGLPILKVDQLNRECDDRRKVNGK